MNVMKETRGSAQGYLQYAERNTTLTLSLPRLCTGVIPRRWVGSQEWINDPLLPCISLFIDGSWTGVRDPKDFLTTPPINILMRLEINGQQIKIWGKITNAKCDW